ncbi:unnamed protein product, partial [Ectocarpus sp. 4 AP-2014]
MFICFHGSQFDFHGICSSASDPNFTMLHEVEPTSVHRNFHESNFHESVWTYVWSFPLSYPNPNPEKTMEASPRLNTSMETDLSPFRIASMEALGRIPWNLFHFHGVSMGLPWKFPSMDVA